MATKGAEAAKPRTDFQARMGHVLTLLLLLGGYLVAAVLFIIGWKLRRAARIAIALVAGAAVAVQTLLLCGLIAWGQAWNGGQQGFGFWWIVPASIYLVLAAGLLMQDDDPLPPSEPSPKRPTPEEDYGPLR